MKAGGFGYLICILFSLPVWEVRAAGLRSAEVQLQYSDDLESWNEVELTADMLTPGGGVLLSDLPDTVFMRIVLAELEGGAGTMVRVEGGTLEMSIGIQSVDTFLIGKYEVTWGEWKGVRDWAAQNGYDIGGIGTGCADNHPVGSVSWYDVVKWCNARSEKEGLVPVYTVSQAVYRAGAFVPSVNPSATGYRLPTEAEWEFAARGGNLSHGYTYAGGNDIELVAWYRWNSEGSACIAFSGRGTWPVGRKLPNELGLYDMTGNAWEWCWDAVDSNSRRIRGGSWNDQEDMCAVSYRFQDYTDGRVPPWGLRVARNWISQ